MHDLTWYIYSAGALLDIVLEAQELFGSCGFDFITKSRKNIKKRNSQKVIILLIKNEAPHSTVQSNSDMSAITSQNLLTLLLSVQLNILLNNIS